jgi:uncharacterized membrane protein YhhN
MKVALGSLFVLFWIILAIDCIFIFNGLDTYRFYSKPLLMPVLYIIMAIQTAETRHRRSKAIASLILLFSFAGDLFLLNDTDLTDSSKSYFTAGVACFFVVHVLYTVFFFRIKRLSVQKLNITIIALPVIFIYIFLLLSALWSKITDEDYGVQIIFYSIAIGLMFIAAVNTATGKRAKSTAWGNFIPGAVLFIVSDSIIAVTKFYMFNTPPKILFAAMNIAVMLTYGAAQFILVSGAIKFIKK